MPLSRPNAHFPVLLLVGGLVEAGDVGRLLVEAGDVGRLLVEAGDVGRLLVEAPRRRSSRPGGKSLRNSSWK